MNGVGIDGSHLVNLKFFVDIEILKSTITLDLVPDIASRGFFTDKKLRASSEKEATENQNTVRLPSLNAIIKRELQMDMKNQAASSRMRNLFIHYHSLLR